MSYANEPPEYVNHVELMELLRRDACNVEEGRRYGALADPDYASLEEARQNTTQIAESTPQAAEAAAAAASSPSSMSNREDFTTTPRQRRERKRGMEKHHSFITANYTMQGALLSQRMEIAFQRKRRLTCLSLQKDEEIKRIESQLKTQRDDDKMVNNFLKAQIWLHGALSLLTFVLFFLLGNFLNK